MNAVSLSRALRYLFHLIFKYTALCGYWLLVLCHLLHLNTYIFNCLHLSLELFSLSHIVSHHPIPALTIEVFIRQNLIIFDDFEDEPTVGTTHLLKEIVWVNFFFFFLVEVWIFGDRTPWEGIDGLLRWLLWCFLRSCWFEYIWFQNYFFIFFPHIIYLLST